MRERALNIWRTVAQMRFTRLGACIYIFYVLLLLWRTAGGGGKIPWRKMGLERRSQSVLLWLLFKMGFCCFRPGLFCGGQILLRSSTAQPVKVFNADPINFTPEKAYTIFIKILSTLNASRKLLCWYILTNFIFFCREKNIDWRPAENSAVLRLRTRGRVKAGARAARYLTRAIALHYFVLAGLRLFCSFASEETSLGSAKFLISRSVINSRQPHF